MAAEEIWRIRETVYVKERQENELLSIFLVMSCSTALCLMG